MSIFLWGHLEVNSVVLTGSSHVFLSFMKMNTYQSYGQGERRKVLVS